MAIDEQPPPLPLEVRGHSAKAIADELSKPAPQRVGLQARSQAASYGSAGITTSQQPEPAGIPGQADWPRGLDPSGTNADTFVPNQMWEPPPRRRHNASLEGAFASGAFDPGAFQVAEELRARAARTIAGGAEVPTSLIGTATLTNFNAVVVQSTAIRCLLVEAIDRAKENGWNSGVAELEVILSLTDNLQHLLLEAAPVDEKVGAGALSFRDALVNL